MMSLTSQRLPACLLGSSGGGNLRCRDLQFLRKAGCAIPHCRSPKKRDSLGKPGNPFDAYLAGIAFSNRSPAIVLVPYCHELYSPFHILLRGRALRKLVALPFLDRSSLAAAGAKRITAL